MTPISNLANQLFISYAHIDNRYFTGSDRGWVDRQHQDSKRIRLVLKTAAVRVRSANARSHQPAA